MYLRTLSLPGCDIQDWFPPTGVVQGSCQLFRQMRQSSASWRKFCFCTPAKLPLLLTLIFCWHQERLQGNCRAVGIPHGALAAHRLSGYRAVSGCSATQLSESALQPERQVWEGFHRLTLLAGLSFVCHRRGRRVPTSSASSQRLVVHPFGFAFLAE